MSAVDGGGHDGVGERVKVERRVREGRTAHARVGRTDRRVVPSQIVEYEPEVALDTAAGPVREEQRGSVAPYVDIELVAVRLEKCLFRSHVQDVKL
ncbi:hypothetical protein [Streptomyces sp. NPDC050355]|uniref:hypothetical protein n=1 Tax=Streptomyces sp. NPDC050355 TaxID=3365609 RepID=UPI0037A0C650